MSATVSSLPPHVALMCAMAALLGLMVLLFPWRLAQGYDQVTAPPLQRFRKSYLMAMTLGSVLLLTLSACGTRPLPDPANHREPVPAALLTPPQAPVLLTPASASTRPGPTTSRTAPAAASTAPTTAR
jgi:hypothetical protein